MESYTKVLGYDQGMEMKSLIFQQIMLLWFFFGKLSWILHWNMKSNEHGQIAFSYRAILPGKGKSFILILNSSLLSLIANQHKKTEATNAMLN